jgi:predicted deacetylase
MNAFSNCLPAESVPQTAAVGRKLIASIHDVGPRFEREIDQLVEIMTRLLGGSTLGMLVVPNHWAQAPIAGNAQFQGRLRAWADAGSEIFVHGWFHLDESNHPPGLARIKARHMTAGEGEFLGLERAEALRRMKDGRALIEDIIGRQVAGFIAPAWLYGPGAMDALAEAGFKLAEDHMKVWRPSDGKVLARGPVVTWASRSRTRIASSILFARIAVHALSMWPTVRVAVHPGDLREASLMASIAATVSGFRRRRAIARYADL